jgi:uncharacterized membrane protein
VTVSAGLLLVFLATSAICIAGIVVIGRARRAARDLGDGDEGLASRAETQHLLAANWARVEQTARSSGMSEEEIKRVRANVLGLHDG